MCCHVLSAHMNVTQGLKCALVFGGHDGDTRGPSLPDHEGMGRGRLPVQEPPQVREAVAERGYLSLSMSCISTSLSHISLPLYHMYHYLSISCISTSLPHAYLPLHLTYLHINLIYLYLCISCISTSLAHISLLLYLIYIYLSHHIYLYLCISYISTSLSHISLCLPVPALSDGAADSGGADRWPAAEVGGDPPGQGGGHPQQQQAHGAGELPERRPDSAAAGEEASLHT